MLFGIGIGLSIMIAAVIFLVAKKMGTGGVAAIVDSLEAEKATKLGLHQRFVDAAGKFVERNVLAHKVAQVIQAQDMLKAERGRNTITQAELETVENRLRELEEIERELEASGIETKEELKILHKKEKELQQKNETLNAQIAASLAQLEQFASEIEMSAQMQEQIAAMKTELAQTETKISELLMQIEQGNEQYFLMKQRYDALDIEYAQLYEKFSETESK